MIVREHALLTTRPSAESSIDQARIALATFEWLIELSTEWSRSLRTVYDQGHPAIKLGSLVGYICSPAGEQIEILPKTESGCENTSESRDVMRRILQSSIAPKQYQANDALLMKDDSPIHEWIFSQYLEELQSLVTHGLKFNYLEIEEQQAFLRGRLNVSAQVQQRPGSEHLFHIRHEIFTPDRLENRLLKTALNFVHSYCATSDNWRLSNTLMQQLDEIPVETAPVPRLKQWSSSRLMQSYNAIKPWCELILMQFNPNFQRGSHRGIALLFPMELLFESYVANLLRGQVVPGWRLRSQAKSKYLIENHKSKALFNLRPDLLLESKSAVQVLDTKWKILDSNNSGENYGLKQSDFYQLFAYAHKYQKGKGDMMLIYPANNKFDRPLPAFQYQEDLFVWVVPFCLKTQKLKEGEWCGRFASLNPSDICCEPQSPLQALDA